MAADGRIIVWNLAATRITGYDGSENLGRHCYEVFQGRDGHGQRFCSPSCPILGQLKCGGPIETFDLQSPTKAGRPMWLNMSTVVLPAGDPNAPRAIRMFRDVTPIREVLALIRGRLAGTPTTHDPISRLTRREVEVLRFLASGATNRAVAERLHVSPATIRNHTHNIFEKLGVANRLAAVTYAISQLLI